MTVEPRRRRLDASVPPEYDLPTREPRIGSPATARRIMWLVMVLGVIGLAGALTSIVAVGAPDEIQRPSAGVLLVVFAIGLTHRAGGYMRIWATLAFLLATVAVVSHTNLALVAAAGATAVLASVWAVMVTRPAGSWLAAVREFVYALVVALAGTVAVAAWNAPVHYQRFNLVVIAVALALAISLVWNLGAGLHGLGRQNLAILVGVAALFLIILAYSSFVRTHGSQAIVDGIGDAIVWMRRNFGGVPRPVEVFIGFPALVIGVSLRSQRREGWWILIFAVIGTGVLTTALVTPGAFPTYIGLSALYSSVLGLGVGLALRRFAMGARSRRAARAVMLPSRVEPPRLAPLK